MTNNTGNANKTTRWGIIGTGTMACDFATGLRALPNAELVGVASRTETRSADFASAFGIPNYFHSYESLAAHPDIDAIHIATPNHRHADDCQMCLEQGKAVLCEKPFTISSEDARKVVAVAREKKVFCMEAMWMRFIPLIQKMRQAVVVDKVIGQPSMLVADFGYPVPHQADNRFFNPELGGGGLLDRGVYPISLACYLLGLPDVVSGACAKDESGVDSSGTISLGWNKGVVAALHYSMLERTSNIAILYGSEGHIVIEAPFFRPHRIVVNHGRPGVEPGDPIAAGASTSGIKGKIKARIKSTLQNTKRRLESMTPPKLGRKGKVWTDFGNGIGYQFEAEEVHRCLQAGQLESETMPLDESIAIVELVEQLSNQWK